MVGMVTYNYVNCWIVGSLEFIPQIINQMDRKFPTIPMMPDINSYMDYKSPNFSMIPDINSILYL